MDPTNSPETPQPQASSPPGGQAISLGRAQVVNFCALGIGICFFLPWVYILFSKVSGFDFQKISDKHKVLWLMPIFCAITLCAGLAGKSQKIAGQLAGLAPFAILGYGLFHQGKGLFDLLAPGAWLALVLGAALFVLVRR